MKNWCVPHIYAREQDIYAFSRKALRQQKTIYHFYLPWQDLNVDDLMFRLKGKINDYGHSYIPLINSDNEPIDLSVSQIENIYKQLRNKDETHLCMSNLNSIHLFKVTDLINAYSIENKSVLAEAYLSRADQTIWWVRVEDIFLWKVSHLEDGVEYISDELDKLVSSVQTQFVFKPVQVVTINGEKQEPSSLNWVKLNRSVTYDYFIRGLELEDNIYQECWREFSRPTQHQLILSDQARNKALLGRDEEKFLLLRESFEAYLSALLNECNEIYILPFVATFAEFSSMFEAWSDIESTSMNPEIKRLFTHMFKHKNYNLDSLEDFLSYMNVAKSFVFSLRSRFSKKIGKEEYLFLENFLAQQDALIDSFHAKKISLKISSILELSYWLSKKLDKSNKTHIDELKVNTSKMSHLLNLMSSAGYDDNVFFAVIEEKTGKKHQAKSLEVELKNLMSKNVKKAA